MHMEHENGEAMSFKHLVQVQPSLRSRTEMLSGLEKRMDYGLFMMEHLRDWADDKDGYLPVECWQILCHTNLIFKAQTVPKAIHLMSFWRSIEIFLRRGSIRRQIFGNFISHTRATKIRFNEFVERTCIETRFRGKSFRKWKLREKRRKLLAQGWAVQLYSNVCCENEWDANMRSIWRQVNCSRGWLVYCVYSRYLRSAKALCVIYRAHDST